MPLPAGRRFIERAAGAGALEQKGRPGKIHRLAVLVGLAKSRLFPGTKYTMAVAAGGHHRQAVLVVLEVVVLEGLLEMVALVKQTEAAAVEAEDTTRCQVKSAKAATAAAAW